METQCQHLFQLLLKNINIFYTPCNFNFVLCLEIPSTYFEPIWMQMVKFEHSLKQVEGKLKQLKPIENNQEDNRANTIRNR